MLLWLHNCRLFLLLLWWLFVIASAQAQEGHPFITTYPPDNYTSSKYSSSPQNWGISQSLNGSIYIANTSGVLVYDGLTWEMVAGTEELWFFKFAQDTLGRIFTGGIDELGYFKADSLGNIHFISLLKHLPKEHQNFGRIVNVVSNNGSIFFKSKHHIFKWSNNNFKVWENDIPYIKLVSSKAGLFVSEKKAFYQYKNDSLISIWQSQSAERINLRGVFPWNFNTDTLMVVSRRNGLFKLYNGNLQHIASSLDSMDVLNGCELQHGQIALATQTRGVVVINQQGQLIKTIDKKSGLQNNQVIFPYYSNQNLLWVAQHNGFSSIEYPSPLSSYTETNGLDAIPSSIMRIGSRLLVGSIGQAMWLTNQSKSAILTQLNAQIPAIHDITKSGEQLVVGFEKGTQVIFEDGSNFSISSKSNCTAVKQSLAKPELLYVANSMVLSFYQKNEPSNFILLDSIIELPHSIYYLVEAQEGNLWATHNGATFIDLSKGISNPIILTLDSTNGLVSEMGIIEASSVGNRVVFGTDLGIYRFDHVTQQLIPDTTFGIEFSNGSRNASSITETENGDVWINSNLKTGLLRKQSDGSYLFDTLPLSRVKLPDVWDIYEDIDRTMWFCATGAIVRYDPNIPFNYRQPYHTIINKVTANDVPLFYGHYSDTSGAPVIAQPDTYVRTLPYAQNNLYFSYTAPYFTAPEQLQYSYILAGHDTSWSAWSSNTWKEYEGLYEGQYTFNVRARNVYGTISEVAAYRFSITAPWYRTTWAYIGYLVAFSLFIWVVVRLSQFRLKREKEKLENIVTQRTEEVRRQKAAIEVQAERLKTANAQLVELDLFKEGMTSMIVHDLKNPLNAILNVSAEHSDAQQLERIKESGRQMLNMVLDILDVYKYENTEMTVDKAPVLLQQLVHHAQQEVQFLTQQKSITIRTQLTDNITVVGDQPILLRVLVNLLTNAIKFTPGGAAVTIKGLVTAEGGRLEVQDEGPGIKEEHLEKVFNKFEQTNIKSSGGIRSTGLGLTFCKMAVEAHGGSIGVNSTFGEGSSFWLLLPLAEQQLTAPVPSTTPEPQKAAFTANDKAFLTPIATTLKTIPYYKISAVLKVLKAIELPNDASTAARDWLQQYEAAARNANEQQIALLLAQIEA